MSTQVYCIAHDVAAEAAAAATEDAAGGRTTRAGAAHAALEVLPGLLATARHQHPRRGKSHEAQIKFVKLKAHAR